MKSLTFVQKFPAAADGIAHYLRAVDSSNFDEITYYVFLGVGKEETILKLINEMVRSGWIEDKSGIYRLTAKGDAEF